ncbi:DEAD/DEAH box helicase [Miltoncostaea oceani]|uniref:DEAD/DEAH box helicase n=1 Tax=Miltoncostaea oceani TaxID=2843216 RepID=UPI001C3D08B9|nr:DEAD/DEAH box helicase [Miltoncostaea oceani]
MTDERGFRWSRIPDAVCFALVEAAVPGEIETDEAARTWLTRFASVPSVKFLGEGERGETVAHALRDALTQISPYALESAYGKAASAGLVPSRGKSPGARGQAQQLGRCRVTSQLRALLLEVLLESGMSSVPDGHARPLSSFMRLPTDEDPVGGQLLAHQRRVTSDLERRWHRDGFRMQGLVVMPTGSGKTRTAVDWLLAGPISSGAKTLWITHSVYLLEQTAGVFIDRSPVAAREKPIGLRLIGGGHGVGKTIGSDMHDVVIATVQSLQRKATLDNVRSWMTANNVVVVFDEAHRAVAPTWFRLVQMATAETGDAVLGLTATPVRMGAGQTATLGRLFGARGGSMADAIISEVSFDELVEQRVLARPITHTISTEIDLEGLLTAAERGEIEKTFGDFPQRVLKQLVKQAPRNQSILQAYLDGPDGDRSTDFGRTIVYAVNIAHATVLATLFKDRGIACEAVHTARSRDENREAIRAFREGEVRVLVNVQMLTEGIDVPGADAVFLTRPTLSLTLFSQMVGRALRGPRMGGTEQAHIVDFQDLLGEFASWRVTFASLGLDGTEVPVTPGPQPPLVPYDLEPLVALALSLGEAHPLPIGRRFQRIPVGYYLIGIDPPSSEAEAEPRSETLLVFDHELDGYQRVAAEVEAGSVDALSRGSWGRFFDDLPHPHPPDESLSRLREFVLKTETMPMFVSLDLRDSLDPATVAAAIVEKGGRGFDDLSRGTREAYDLQPSVVDRVWGGPDQFAHDVREEWVRLLEGRPVALEQRRLRLPVAPAQEVWSYGNGALDLDVLLGELVNNRELFPIPLPRPPGSVRWTTKPIRDWAFYRFRDEAIFINSLFDSRDLEEPELVRFLLFHELLHHEQKLFLGHTGTEPDSVAHGQAFYEREHTFPDFARLDAFMDDFRRRFSAG